MANQKKKSVTERKKNKREIKEFDLLLFVLPLVLIGFGIIMVYSSSVSFSLRRVGDPYHYLKRQVIWAVLGVLCLVFISRFNHTFFRKCAYPLLGISIVLLLLVIFPGIGKTANGARRWLKIGFFNIQPSEPAKLALIFSLSHLLVKKEELIKDFQYTFLPFLVILGTLFLLVVVQPDLGTAIVIACVGLVLAFVAGVRIYYLFALVTLSIPVIVSFAFRHSYIKDRLRAFLNPWGDPLNTGFQTIQSFLAFGMGGWTGVGLGRGLQKRSFLPEPHTDFIFSVVGEEFGFLGCITVIGVFCLLLWRISRLMLSTDDSFSFYLVVGIGFMIALESIINIGVTLGFFPTKGLAFPFLSYGGSAMVVKLSAMGVLISISRAAPAQS